MFYTAAVGVAADGTASATTVWFLKNTRTEAFALHLRNLIVFLYQDQFPLKTDDVSAHHFLASPAPYEEWLRIRPKLSDTLARAKTRADKELAHLTTARLSGTPKEKEWDVRGPSRNCVESSSYFPAVLTQCD